MSNSTIKSLCLSLVLLGFGALVEVNAQQWNGNNNPIDPIWRTGNVGIGISTPTRPFQLRGSNTVLQIDRDTKDPGFGVTRYSPGFGQVWKSFFFYTEGNAPNDGRFIIADWGTNVSGPSTPRLVIGNTGNIGLGGELNPAYPLDINGGATVGIQYDGPTNNFAGAYMNGGLPFYGYKRNNSILAYHYMDQSQNWLLYNNGVRLSVASNGNVTVAQNLGVNGDANVGGVLGVTGNLGVGTTPSYKLHVDADKQVGFQLDAGDAVWGGMYLNAKNGGKPFYGYQINGAARAWSYVDDATLAWHLSVGGGDRILVTNTGNVSFPGNVGIGVDASTAALKVGTTNGIGSRVQIGSAEYIEDGGGFIITVNGSLISAVNGLDNLGSNANAWNNLYYDGSLIATSDKRAKEDINQLKSTSALDKLLKLNPVTYHYKNAPNQALRTGLIAQEVQKVIPEIVYDPRKDLVRNEEGGFSPVTTDENALMGVNYIDLIPYLIAALQEQENKITALKDELAKVKTKAGLEGTNLDDIQEAKLFQNQPNPFNQSTKIRVFLPESVQSATLHIYDLQGKSLNRMIISGRGETEAVIQANTLQAGMYIYSLIADGKEVGTYRMILE